VPQDKRRWANVFCLEGLWDEEEFADRTSVLPLLEFLERSGIIDFVHRDVATRAELKWHLDRWLNQDNDFWTLYLGFHGSSGCLYLSPAESVTLDELAVDLAARLTDCVLYLGSCSVVADGRGVGSFIDQTGARAVIGYRKDVDWLQSSAMDLFVLGTLAYYARAGTALKTLENDPVTRTLRNDLGLEVFVRS
jgi:hypothetical protein